MTTQPKVRFKLSQGFDLSITLDIDISVLTPDIAEEVSTFWASKDEVREASEGNVYEAVARYAAGPLLRDLLDGWTPGWDRKLMSIDKTAVAQFGHHPDPAIDFCIEVESLLGEIENHHLGFFNGTPSRNEMNRRIERAYDFRVGGDQNAVKAKLMLRDAVAKKWNAQPVGVPDGYKQIGWVHPVYLDQHIDAGALAIEVSQPRLSEAQVPVFVRSAAPQPPAQPSTDSKIGYMEFEEWAVSHGYNVQSAPDGGYMDVYTESACTGWVAAKMTQPSADVEDGLSLVSSEYDRQRRVEGFTPEHDDEHTKGELAMAAACYAKPGRFTLRNDGTPAMWPWSPKWWKPRPDNRIRELMKAGALIVAEIDRLLRAERRAK